MMKTFMIGAAIVTLSASAEAQTCTRDDLKTFIARYFTAVEAHSMAALPTAPNLRVTENGVETRAGEGFFKTGGKVQFQRSLIDTARCGTLTEAVVAFDSFADDPKDLPNFATPCHRWEGGVYVTAKTGNCSPKGLVLTHTHRRFPVADVEAGITAGFINFNQALPDVHMFKFKDGQIVWIQAVFGGRVQGAVWPDEQ